jgi:hypothetical protein
MSKTLYSKRTQKAQSIMLAHRKRASVATMSEGLHGDSQVLHVPNHLIQYKKFLGILNTLRSYER